MHHGFLLCAFVALLAATAGADTGGSMGGGDWGGGGADYSSSSSDYSSSYSSSSDYSYSSSSDHGSTSWSSGGGGGGGASGPLIGLALSVLLIGGAIYAGARGAQPPQQRKGPSVRADVSVLRIALDGRARKFVQSELARIARSTDTSTAKGRKAMLRDVALLLRRMRDAWVYGGAVNEPMRELGKAKNVFERHVDEARSRFREETVRHEQGKTTERAASEYTPKSHEGAGVILVSIILAARRELFTVRRIADGHDLRAALEAACELDPQTLVAIEVVWQPSVDEDRMSSVELEAKYPAPELVPLQNALVGKVFCEYCSGPYPAEILSCPFCGAPSASRRA